ncbi:hypothetical protein EGW08_012367 [Elysia chlorotica]|uniref:Uncharacterized protein n=1 Tax=Elysia chlorotica TaxID=188477 RepID=A0A3S1B4S9_ELYCH|nr:hypothetical protein EGW08_012367 [Elysia chlorotica]
MVVALAEIVVRVKEILVVVVVEMVVTVVEMVMVFVAEMVVIVKVIKIAVVVLVVAMVVVVVVVEMVMVVVVVEMVLSVVVEETSGRLFSRLFHNKIKKRKTSDRGSHSERGYVLYWMFRSVQIDIVQLYSLMNFHRKSLTQEEEDDPTLSLLKDEPEDDEGERWKRRNMLTLVVTSSLNILGYGIYGTAYSQWIYVRFQMEVMGDKFSQLNGSA